MTTQRRAAKRLDTEVERITRHAEKYWDLVGLAEADMIVQILRDLQSRRRPESLDGRPLAYREGFCDALWLAIRLICGRACHRLRISEMRAAYEVLKDFSALHEAKGDVHKAAGIRMNQ